MTNAHVKASMMHQTEKFAHTNVPELNHATVLAMPFKAGIIFGHLLLSDQSLAVVLLLAKNVGQHVQK